MLSNYSKCTWVLMLANPNAPTVKKEAVSEGHDTCYKKLGIELITTGSTHAPCKIQFSRRKRARACIKLFVNGASDYSPCAKLHAFYVLMSGQGIWEVSTKDSQKTNFKVPYRCWNPVKSSSIIQEFATKLVLLLFTLTTLCLRPLSSFVTLAARTKHTRKQIVTLRKSVAKKSKSAGC